MEDITHLIGHVLEHSIEDTLYLIPFLFVTYLAMEWLEHKAGDKAEDAVRRAGAAGPVVGALVGIVPQCGFSAAAATLWAGRVITLGTLFAVFLSTSDEMLPIFLAEQVAPATILKIMGVKLMIGMVMGFVVDAVIRLARRDREKLRIHELCERDRCHCNGDCETCEQQPELAYDFEHDEEHGHHHEGGSILRSALKHTVQVTVFIFIITLVLDGALELVGEDALAAFLGSNPVLSVLGSALVGLIPNCAASVVIAQLYVEGALGAGAMMAGLLVSAGVGLLVLFRTNRGLRQNLIVLAGLWATGVFWGLIISAFGIAF
ncbi:MAG: putative manganese transporter [Senegalimassilia anaerobia]|uniref:putative manganese transporter n=1 Tax=Senegalimassilia anaerobia TaxID=1473216 RepID=UPI002E7875F8|nr:putative manganese transporter [Senegalimassilia anaerobia]MEE0303613.1 putative manganese transporter [Senegalimassilia anaerobia]